MKKLHTKGFAHVGLIALAVLVLTVIAGAGWYVQNNDNAKNNNHPTSESDTNKATDKLSVDAAAFSDSLAACTQTKLQFTHPLTGDKLYKYVKGMTAEKCEYYEEMPNNGHVTCMYTELERKAVAQYYKDSASGKLGTESTDTVDEKVVYKNSAGITYDFDSVTTANPAGTAIEKGICKVGGY